MIVRIEFEGTVRNANKKSVLEDHIDMHATDVERAKVIFLSWVHEGAGIRGANNIFHPLHKFGEIKLKSVTEFVEKKKGK